MRYFKYYTHILKYFQQEKIVQIIKSIITRVIIMIFLQEYSSVQAQTQGNGHFISFRTGVLPNKIRKRMWQVSLGN